MTSGPDPYGGLPQYPGEYPGQYASGPPPQPSRPPIPSTVQAAFRLMIAGAVVQAIGLIVSLTQIDAMREAVAESLRDSDPNVSQETIDATVGIGIVVATLIGLVYIGLWIWMAFANRAGKNWARITGTVFFAILTLFTLASIASSAAGAAADNAFSAGTSTVPALVISVLNWAVGLAALIMLWNRRSSEYFKPPAPYGGHGPGPY